MKGLFVFTHDLRLRDNPALLEAAQQCSQLSMMYCLDDSLAKPGRYSMPRLGHARLNFLRECIEDLDAQLGELKQSLILKADNPLNALAHFIQRNNIEAVFYSSPVGVDEIRLFEQLQQRCPDCHFSPSRSSTLYTDSDRPSIVDFKTYTPFKRWAEQHEPAHKALNAPVSLPPPLSVAAAEHSPWPNWFDNAEKTQRPLVGGERKAMNAVKQFLGVQRSILSYQDTRNTMGDYSASSMLSAYLSMGCISVGYLWREVRAFEQQYGADASTQCYRNELLWREFFQWQLLQHGSRFFRLSGLGESKPLLTFYAEYFAAWCQGNTGIPVIDANMRELMQTGFMSNRGRQLVASYLVNDMGVDWRFGAAYFEALLLDYDVANNWGNWMYIAGVGHDPRKDRYFSLPKQTQRYDPQARYVSQWLPALNALPEEQRHFPFLHDSSRPQPVCMPRDMLSVGAGEY